MRYLFAAGAVTAALVSGVVAECVTENYNSYCNPVKKISYYGVGGSGSYNKITGMDSKTATCSSTPFSYSGSMAPLNEDVSLHFRGPLRLKQFAVYTPGSSSSSSSSNKAKRSVHHRRHAHGHQHFHERSEEIREIQERAEAGKRAVGDMVIATINGEVVSWVNEYDGKGVATPAAQAASSAPAAAEGTTITGEPVTTTKHVAYASPSGAASAASAASSSESSPADVPVSAGDWSRIAYYNAEKQTATGLTFLNNMGGQGSGVFDNTFGNSLSYAASDAMSGCASPEVLKDIQIPSNSEFSIMSDKECKDGSCGFFREGSVAYHGFAGAQKAFLMEFSMPDDKETGFNGNMPAIWMLNAQIPRTAMYGLKDHPEAECSCWKSGCAEFDIFEVLDSGNTKCKSTLHGNINGGDSDYFVRPTDAPIKAAVVMNDDQIHIQILPDDTAFGGSLPSETISTICEKPKSDDKNASIFMLGGAA